MLELTPISPNIQVDHFPWYSSWPNALILNLTICPDTESDHLSWYSSWPFAMILKLTICPDMQVDHFSWYPSWPFALILKLTSLPWYSIWPFALIVNLTICHTQADHLPWYSSWPFAMILKLTICPVCITVILSGFYSHLCLTPYHLPYPYIWLDFFLSHLHIWDQGGVLNLVKSTRPG